ncbi:MAG: hypothetical protein JO360_06430 [Acidobacteria bacterium]|nr:hypothetical protein [Acidobacteriota bacterium]
MVAVLITSFLLLAIISFAIYRWQQVSSGEGANRALPPAPPDFKGLFAAAAEEEQSRLEAAQAAEELAERKRALLSRAEAGDRHALLEAHESGDAALYEEALNALVRQAANGKQVFALASYIARQEGLTVNLSLAEAFAENWKNAPDRRTTAELLHVAALAGDATVYQRAIETLLLYWREQRLPDMSAAELTQLIESEYWLLPSHARSSGAGFLLKREIASARRQLQQ